MSANKETQIDRSSRPPAGIDDLDQMLAGLESVDDPEQTPPASRARDTTHFGDTTFDAQNIPSRAAPAIGVKTAPPADKDSSALLDMLQMAPDADGMAGPRVILGDVTKSRQEPSRSPVRNPPESDVTDDVRPIDDSVLSELVALPQTPPNAADPVPEPEIALLRQPHDASDSTPNGDREKARKRFRTAGDKAAKVITRNQDSIPNSEPGQVKKLGRRLNSTPANDFDQVCEILCRLGATRSPNAIEYIRDARNRRQAEVRTACADALGQIVHSSSALTLLELLNDRSVQVSEAALRSLVAQQQPDCLAALMAFSLLHPWQQPVLLDALTSLDEEERQIDIAALRNIVKSRNAEMSAFAVQLLSALTGAEYATAFSKLTDHSSPLVREAAVAALARSKGKRVIGLINSAMADNSGRVRAAAAAGLAEQHSPKSVVLLLAALRDPETRVRRAAAETLSGLTDVCIGQAAAAALESESDEITAATLVKTLCRLGTSDALPILQRELQSDDRERRHQAIATVRRHRIHAAEPELLVLLQDADSETRRLAVQALAVVGSKSSRADVRGVLKDDRAEDVRATAARTLGEFKDKKAIHLLEEALHDERQVRCQAVIALGQIGEQKTLPAILAQLKDSAPEIRRNACAAIGQIGNLANPEPLRALLDDSDSMVRRSAESALNQLGVKTSGNVILSPLRRLIRKSGGSLLPNFAAGGLPASTLGVAAVLLLFVGGIGYGIMKSVGSGSVSSVPADTHLSYVIAASLNAKGDTLAVLRRRGVVEAWDTSTGELRTRFQTDPQCRQMLFSDDIRVLLYGRNGLNEWDTTADPRGSNLKAIASENVNTAQQIILLPDRKTAFLLAGRNFTVFDVESGQGLRSFETGQPLPPSTAVSPDQTLVVYGDPDGSIVFLSSGDGRKIHEFSASRLLGRASPTPIAKSIAFSADSRQMAIAFSTGHLQLWDMQKIKPIRTIEKCRANRLMFAPDGSLIAAGQKQVDVYRDKLTQHKSISVDDMGDPAWLNVSSDSKTIAVFVGEERDLWLFDLDDMKLTHKLSAE